MGKSLRSKVKKRFRALRRGHINQIKTKPETEELNSKCQKGLAGIEYREKQKKNAFLYPNDPEAHFPQYKQPPIIDLRSAYIPGSGLEWSGATRKKEKIIPHLDEVASKRPKDTVTEDIEEQEPMYTKNDQMKEEGTSNLNKKKKKVSKLRKTIVF